MSIALGALVGMIASPRHHFILLEPGAAPPLLTSPSRLSAPGGKRSAIVVARSAEVHSAPFNVAPVVVVLRQGQGLFVEATPRVGWRVATLLDGRAGYIQDAEVKSDSP